MRFSKFGGRLTAQTGIGQLMEDLGQALGSGGKDLMMLGGGNPAHIPAVQQVFRKHMETIMEEPGRFEKVIGNYDSPQGNEAFLDALADLFNNEYGWGISRKNIVLTNGSQTGFFILFNMFAGEYSDGTRRKIQLPLAPEYIGYADTGLADGFFTAERPEIRELGNHIFKYYVDFEAINITEEVGAICVSRPTNPTGNVLTTEEIEKLAALARQNNIPFMIDNAYGTPFPNIIFNDAVPYYDENTIVSMSLSKLGLPATRTGIIIAREDVIRAISNVNGIMCLSPSGMGAGMAYDLVKTGEILNVSRELIRPYYQQKAERSVEQLQSELDGVDYFIHKPEGALFLWLWFRNLPITSAELYQRLKQRGVLVVSGHYFFPGVDHDWRHKDECIRVSYAGDDQMVTRGLSIIAEVVKEAYAEQTAVL